MGLKAAFLVCALVAASSAAALAADRGTAKAPAPRLVSPSDEASVGPQGLEFRWSPEAGSWSTRHFDFRLYEGPQTYEKGLILKEEIPAGRHSVVVPAERFVEGRVYSWSLRAIGSQKSRSAYSVFKVVEKA